MADAVKRNLNSKPRKSKNDIIRSTLGTYLKQRNYSASEKFRKYDLPLTHNAKQSEFNMMLQDDVSKVNSMIYSNVMCLSNNAGIVEQQFSKFLAFVQSQSVPVRGELQLLLNPLMCHLYIELLKGRDSQPAQEFLKKFAHIVGTVDSLSAPSLLNNVSAGGGVVVKLNGSSSTVSEEYLGATSAAPAPQQQQQQQPSSVTHITYVPSDLAPTEPEQTQYFKELISSMSMCLRIEELDAVEITRNFRYSKYEHELSQRAVIAVKQHLKRNGHVIILHVFQTWFTFDITDIRNSSSCSEDDTKQSGGGGDGGGTTSTMANGTTTLTASVVAGGDEGGGGGSDMDSGIASDWFAQIKADYETTTTTNNVKTENAVMDADDGSTTKHHRKHFNHKLRNIRKAVVQMKTYEQPVRVFKIANTDDRLSCGNIDENECHLACGFDDSTVRLWQLNQSTIYGRKPYASFRDRLCGWNLDHNRTSDDDDDDDDGGGDDEEGGDEATNYLARNFGQNVKRSVAVRQFMGQRSSENVFTDSGGISLRGHSKGVTDLLFSRHSPLLLSVSKDCSMRAWRAHDYVCGAVYRGHNYPVWCVTESSVGLYLATGSRDLTARLWSTDREFPLQTYVGHTQDVDAIAFHPNGNYIATGSTDQTVRLWCVTSGKLFRVFTDCHLPVQCVSFSPDGKYLAAAGEESKIRIFDLAAGSQFSELKEHTAPVTDLVWNTLGNQITSCCADGSVRVFKINKLNTNTPTVVPPPPPTHPQPSQPTTTTSAPPFSSPPPAAQSTNSNATASMPPSTSSSSSNANSSPNKMSLSFSTGCKRCVKCYFNGNGTISCIGNA